MLSSLVYIHIGPNLPKYLYDSLYQTLLINHYKTKIYVILDDNLVSDFNNKISNFNLDIYNENGVYYENILQVIPLSLLDIRMDNSSSFNNYKQLITNRFENLSEFRNGFWVSTTARFYYINALMQMFSLENVFHIENDIMLYENTNDIYNSICQYFEIANINKICMVQDSDKRVVPSILFFPNASSIDNLTQYITNELNASVNFINDMDILGSYQDKLKLPFTPEEFKIIFDGAAIGQYLGGVDYKNLNDPENPKTKFDNPSRGFVNETSLLKTNEYNYSTANIKLEHLGIPIRVPTLYTNIQNQIVNLHVHSKQLYQFSSVFDLKYKDIITGDRILELCDFVILTKDIYNFHKNIDKYAKDVIIIKDFNNINIKLLNTYFKKNCEMRESNTVKLFVYTHILESFQTFIFPYLDKSINYVLYLHNSDHTFDDKYIKLIQSPNIKHIYAQNINTSVDSNKLTLLPIGIANEMWTHGNMIEFYTVVSETYKNKKSKSIYININPSTYPYRKNILDKIIEQDNLEISSSKPYIEYLRELANCRFCLCIRGNGIDTHRFFESLYLGVIPIIINNKYTNMNNHVKYLRNLGLPFYEIKNDNLDEIFIKYTSEYFNENLYKKLIRECGSSIFNLESLKLRFYK